MTLRMPRFWPAMFVGHAIYAAFAALTVRSVHESRIGLVIAWLIALVAVGVLRAGRHFTRRMDRATTRWAVFGFYGLIGVWLLSLSVELIASSWGGTGTAGDRAISAIHRGDTRSHVHDLLGRPAGHYPGPGAGEDCDDYRAEIQWMDPAGTRICYLDGVVNDIVQY